MTYLFMDFEDCQYWIEVDKYGSAWRQIIIDGKDLLVSCRHDCLAEGVVDTVNGCQQINESDFEKKWEQVTLPYREQWIDAKQKYAIGSTVSGKVKYDYPQGVVFALGNIQGCANVSDDDRVYPDYLISGIVTAYDDVNMWVLIGECAIEPHPVLPLA